MEWLQVGRTGYSNFCSRLLVLLLFYPMAIAALERTALVIGNGAYEEAALRNPVNDAKDMAQVLEELGFEVILRRDVDQQAFEDAVREFQQRLQRKGGVGLFYYAGHGIQADGRNYLIPVGAEIRSETGVRYKAVDAGFVLGHMDEAKASLNIVILDACRDNPYERSFRSGSRGLVRIEVPGGELGSLLAYSTAPGKVAADGSGRNSPYTKHLLRVLRIPDLPLEQVFKKVRIAVYEETHRQQRPWELASLLGDFYFLQSGEAVDTVPGARVTTPATVPARYALTVETEPADARVQILNISSRYYPGLRLPPGRYLVEVSKPGYEKHEEWIALTDADRFVAVTLMEVATPGMGKMFQDRLKDGSLGPELVGIRGGCFQMGSPETEAGRDEDERQHRACVEDFALGKYEVSVAEFRRFVEATAYLSEASQREGCYYWDNEWILDEDKYWGDPGFSQEEDYPAVCLSWNDAVAYTEWLSKETGEGYRLPTETEWEYGARAGTESARFWGDNPGQACQYANVADETVKEALAGSAIHACQDGYVYTAPVGRFRPNAFGLHDMLGNVWEWTCSTYDEAYGGEEKHCVEGKGTASELRVLRGGSWYSTPRSVRAAHRNWYQPGKRYYFLGFRLARTP